MWLTSSHFIVIKRKGEWCDKSRCILSGGGYQPQRGKIGSWTAKKTDVTMVCDPPKGIKDVR